MSISKTPAPPSRATLEVIGRQPMSLAHRKLLNHLALAEFGRDGDTKAIVHHYVDLKTHLQMEVEFRTSSGGVRTQRCAI